MSVDTNTKRTVDRRTVLKTVGATAGAAAVGTGLSGSAFADSGIPFYPTAPSGLGLRAGSIISNWTGNVQTSSAGEVAIYNDVRTAFSTWKDVSVIHIDNAITNSQMVADLNARNAIATAYENGQTSGDARQAAIDEIESYHANIERNAIASKMANLIAIANARKVAANDSNIPAVWESVGFSTADTNYSGSGSLVGDKSYIQTGTSEVTRTLVDGSTAKMECSTFQMTWDNGDSYTGTLFDLLGYWDSSTSEFTGIPTANGNTFSWSGTQSIPAVSSANLPGIRGLSVKDLAERIDSINSNMSTLAGNYDLSFVDKMFSAMDDGTVTPNQVRGSTGLAELMSGSTAATDSRFKLALSTVTDVPHPSVDSVSSMDVSITGYRGVDIYADTSGNRIREPTSHVSEYNTQGLLYASDTPDSLDAGNTYVVDNLVFAGGKGGSLELLDVQDNYASLWSTSITSAKGVSVPAGGEFAIVAGENATLSRVSTSTGNVTWEVDRSTQSAGVDFNHDIDALEVLSDGDSAMLGNEFAQNVTRIDTADGSVIWENTDPGQVYDIALSKDEETVFYGDSNSELAALAVSDGTEQWAISPGSTDISTVLAAPEQGYVIIGSGGGDLRAVDPSTQNVQWTTTVGPNRLEEICHHPTKPWVVVADSSSPSNIDAVAISDGTSQWSNTIGSGTVADSTPLPGRNQLFICNKSGSIYLLDGADGSQISSYSVGSSQVTACPLHYKPNQTVAVDGAIQNGQFSAVTSASSLDAQQLIGARLTINSMSDKDGNDVQDIDTSDPSTRGGDGSGWGSPNYDTVDLDEFEKEQERLNNKYKDALKDSYDDSNFSGVFGGTGGSLFDGLPTIPGLGVVESAIVVALGFLGLNALSS